MERTMKYTLLISALLVGAVGALTVNRYMTASEPTETVLSGEELSGIVEEAGAPTVEEGEEAPDSEEAGLSTYDV